MNNAEPTLVLLAYPSGERFVVAGDNVLVGRHSSADWQLPRVDVSRRHCRLLFDDGSWRVVDLCSTNGTFVNGQRVEDEELRPGDILRIGGFEFEVPDSARGNRSIIRGIADSFDGEQRQAS